jgi:hypothetical protein
MKWMIHIAEMRNADKILVINPERKSTLGIPRCRWGLYYKS